MTHILPISKYIYTVLFLIFISVTKVTPFFKPTSTLYSISDIHLPKY